MNYTNPPPDLSTASETEIIKWLKEEFPVGTKFISPKSADSYIIGEKHVIKKVENGYRAMCGAATPYLIYNNNIAEIIKRPTRSNELNYELY